MIRGGSVLNSHLRRHFFVFSNFRAFVILLVFQTRCLSDPVGVPAQQIHTKLEITNTKEANMREMLQLSPVAEFCRTLKGCFTLMDESTGINLVAMTKFEYAKSL